MFKVSERMGRLLDIGAHPFRYRDDDAPAGFGVIKVPLRNH
jgi:hypothetical protein